MKIPLDSFIIDVATFFHCIQFAGLVSCLVTWIQPPFRQYEIRNLIGCFQEIANCHWLLVEPEMYFTSGPGRWSLVILL